MKHEVLIAKVDAPRSSVALERSYQSHDGAQIFYRCWPARRAETRGAVVLFHRGHEHGGRMAHLVDELGLADHAFYAWDARGHGRSSGKRGHSPSFATSVRDIDCFVREISARDGIAVEDITVIAQSVGAVLAATWVHDYAPRLRALVLAAPAFDVKLYVPFARQGIALWQKLAGPFFVNSYVKARFLTHDRERIASFENDPLITRPIASNMLLDLYDNAERIVADAGAITVPTQLLVSGSDFVVRQAPQHEFFVKLGSAVKERHVLAGFFHDTLGEKNRALALAEVRRFIAEQYNRPAPRQDLTTSDRAGYTRDEADRLATPLNALSAKGAWWALNRAMIRIGAAFSEGLSTGVRTGFDSGSMLDYVYEDRSRGFGPGGRLIDRIFLDAVGWRGIRRRKTHLEELIPASVARLQAMGRNVDLLDIAAGHGRYVLDAIALCPQQPASVTLRDYSDINVVAGSSLIRSRGLPDTVVFRNGDAFDAASLAAQSPAPDLAIVSGLYELFADNTLVARSLDGLARVMTRGSLLIYTNQPWHPQLEMIARCLTSHRDGKPWVMRRRSQAEMDQLVERAGFRKIDQRIDRWGIFTVAVAERI